MGEGTEEKQTPERAPLRPYEAYVAAVRAELGRQAKTEEGVERDKAPELPEVILEASHGNTSTDAHFRISFTSTEPLDKGSKTYIGNVSLVLNDRTKVAHIKYISIYDYWREHETLRFGYAAYLAVIKYLLEQNQKFRLVSGHMLSKGARGVWEGFRRAGIARITTKGDPVKNPTYSLATNDEYELI